jgi:hypothetical protein
MLSIGAAAILLASDARLKSLKSGWIEAVRGRQQQIYMA